MIPMLPVSNQDINNNQQEVSAARSARGDKPAASEVISCLIFIFLFYSFTFYITPNSPPNPNPNRTVKFNNTDGDFGFEVQGGIVKEIISGGAADLNGGLEMEDEVLSVNGVQAYGLNWKQIEAILQLKDDVSLVVIAKYEESRWHKFLHSLGFAFFGTLLFCVFFSVYAVCSK